jgi:hypothetical protein
MTPVAQLYIIRLVLGIIAGALSAVFAYFVGNPSDITTLIDGLTVALAVYLISYYPLKAVYKEKIEKQSKILSTGIFMYFFAWIPFFVLFFTLMKIY